MSRYGKSAESQLRRPSAFNLISPNQSFKELIGTTLHDPRRYPLLDSSTLTMAQEEHSEHAYHPQDAIGGAVKATLLTGGAGAFVSTVQNTLTRHNVGALGAFTRFGGTTAVFGRSRAFPREESSIRLTQPQLPWEEHTHSQRSPRPTSDKRMTRSTR